MRKSLAFPVISVQLYAMHTAAMLASWNESVRPRFAYCVSVMGHEAQRLTLIQQMIYEEMPIIASAKGVHDDVGVQDERHHLLRNCFLKRASDSRRSFRTHAAAPALSSGWSLSFQLPTACRSASFWRAMSSALRTASVMKRLRSRFSTRRSRSLRTSLGRVTCVRDVLMDKYVGLFDAYTYSVRRHGHMSRPRLLTLSTPAETGHVKNNPSGKVGQAALADVAFVALRGT